MLKYTHMNIFIKRLKKNNGEVHFILVFAFLLAVVLLTIIAVPLIRDGMDEQAAKLDKQAETTALRLVREEVAGQIRGEKEYVFDESRNIIRDGSEAAKVEPYGSSREHKGKIIYIRETADGEIIAEWKTPGRATFAR